MFTFIELSGVLYDTCGFIWFIVYLRWLFDGIRHLFADHCSPFGWRRNAPADKSNFLLIRDRRTNGASVFIELHRSEQQSNSFDAIKKKFFFLLFKHTIKEEGEKQNRIRSHCKVSLTIVTQKNAPNFEMYSTVWIHRSIEPEKNPKNIDSSPTSTVHYNLSSVRESTVLRERQPLSQNDWIKVKTTSV